MSHCVLLGSGFGHNANGEPPRGSTLTTLSPWAAKSAGSPQLGPEPFWVFAQPRLSLSRLSEEAARDHTSPFCALTSEMELKP